MRLEKGTVALKSLEFGAELITTAGNHHFHFERLGFGCWATLSAGTNIITLNIFRYLQPERRFPTLGY